MDYLTEAVRNLDESNVRVLAALMAGMAGREERADRRAWWHALAAVLDEERTRRGREADEEREQLEQMVDGASRGALVEDLDEGTQRRIAEQLDADRRLLEADDEDPPAG